MSGVGRKKVFVGFKFGHMGDHAGYDLVRSYVDYDEIINLNTSYQVLNEFLARKSLFARIYVRIFGSRIWWAELICLWLAFCNRKLVFHFIYPENTYKYLWRFRWLGFRIVCTYHQPLTFFEAEPGQLHALLKADAVVVLGRDLVKPLQRLRGDAQVYFIPHGVDVNYFCPGFEDICKKNILMVGNWLRDFSFANSVFKRLQAEFPDLEINVVATQSNLALIEAGPCIHLHDRISDEDLLQHYRMAGCLFLPLKGYVANNALLEAGSVGCPVVVASDQVAGNEAMPFVTHVPLEIGAALKAIRCALERTEQRSGTTSAWVRQEFGWPTLGERIKMLLDSIA